jgi:hypothetical protein
MLHSFMSHAENQVCVLRAPEAREMKASDVSGDLGS